MHVNCEGCGACCLDWRPIGPASLDRERLSDRPPLDENYHLVPLLRDEIRDFVDADYGDALSPRLFLAGDDDETVTVDGYDLAAMDGRPVFLVGIRKLPKPVSPFGVDPVWLDTCAFLDPTTLQCRIHDSDHYPRTCATYPAHNLLLGKETECERVEAAYGGGRLLDDDPGDVSPPLFGRAVLGAKLFVYPDPDDLVGRVERIAAGDQTDADRARFVGAAVGTAVGSTEVNETRAAAVREQVAAADSWVGAAAADWATRAGARGSDAPDPETVVDDAEEGYGAPETPGW
jgi:Fe-S-cluster containining protein